MEKYIKKCLASLRSRHIKGNFAADFSQACDIALDLIPAEAVVGLGDSSTVRRIGLLDRLKERETTVLNPFATHDVETAPEAAYEYTEKTSRQASVCDVFVTGTNALTQDGRLVNVDAAGNRVAGMFWGHPLSIIIIGRNKVVENLDEAFKRIRQTIAPNHTFLKSGDDEENKPDIPCARSGQCRDCRSPNRACNVFTIIESKPLRTELHETRAVAKGVESAEEMSLSGNWRKH